METEGEHSNSFRKQLFKSYYVVWKPNTEKLTTDIVKGLNRTMQYGNVVHPNVRNCCVRGLNRTMQYGNLKLPVHGCAGIRV